MSKYTNATYGGETKVLENEHMRVEVHKRPTGWGYIEIYTPDGKLMGVMPHLSELQDNIGGQRGNMVALRRLESNEAKVESDDSSESLVFDVHSMTNFDFVKGSYVERFADATEKPNLVGQVKLILEKGKAVLRLEYSYKWGGLSGMASLKGPWLFVGADSFGQTKTDAIFPGIEWLRAHEWSSSRNHMLYPLAERTAPHSFKVSIPLMAVSHEGYGIGLAWDPLHPLTERRPLQVTYYPQPVFSSPNAVDHSNNHLCGLMFPSSANGAKENCPLPDYITPCDPMATISFKAEVFLAKGNSLDIVSDWVCRHTLPEPPNPRRSLMDTLDFIASCYNSNLWHDNKGWSIRTEKDIVRDSNNTSSWYAKPAHMERYLKEYGETKNGKKLAEKYAIASKNPGYVYGIRDVRYIDDFSHEKRIEFGDGLLSIQKPDGSFLFEPENSKSLTFAEAHELNHTIFAVNIHKALGEQGDTALEMNVVTAINLLRLTETTGEKKYLEAACRALNFCMDTIVPDGGDLWETPMHSPNLLAAGHASIAYELAYRATNNVKYREKAIYWLRGLLVFTHLWEPKGVHDLYCTKPCFCATDWTTTSWVDTHVQWEVILSLASASILGIDWAEVDPEIDWHRYEEGIVCAATHWLLDSSRADELPLDIDLPKGNLDGLIADQHDPITGQLFGWQLMPDYLAIMIMDTIKRKKGEIQKG